MKSNYFTPKKGILFSFLITVLFALSACGLDEKLSKEITVDARDIWFDVKQKSTPILSVKSETDAVSALQVLYEGTINVNVADKLAEHGLSVDHIKTFALYQSTMTVEPGEYTDANVDLNTFRDMKLYFDNTQAANLVASVQNVDAANGSITFKIENPNQLDKLKNNSIHVIVTKETIPIYTVRFKLKMKFNARVSLLK